ncbi:MAG: hypothetical protein Q8S13_05005 [Dehalococcoidia bacterium]|nr:hypothetical protein [Dehalococcoidia bacterium]
MTKAEKKAEAGEVRERDEFREERPADRKGICRLCGNGSNCPPAGTLCLTCMGEEYGDG